jgi:hypothetical protein
MRSSRFTLIVKVYKHKMLPQFFHILLFPLIVVHLSEPYMTVGVKKIGEIFGI